MPSGQWDTCICSSMERSELEKCESSVKHRGRDEISKRRGEGEIKKEWEWMSLQRRLRGWPREVPRETTWGQKKAFPVCLFILIETNEGHCNIPKRIQAGQKEVVEECFQLLRGRKLDFRTNPWDQH